MHYKYWVGIWSQILWIVLCYPHIMTKLTILNLQMHEVPFPTHKMLEYTILSISKI